MKILKIIAPLGLLLLVSWLAPKKKQEIECNSHWPTLYKGKSECFFCGERM